MLKIEKAVILGIGTVCGFIFMFSKILKYKHLRNAAIGIIASKITGRLYPHVWSYHSNYKIKPTYFRAGYLKQYRKEKKHG